MTVVGTTNDVTHLKYPSIDQFRTVVKQVRDQANWHSTPLPTLTFQGTVKLHGTNAAVVSDGTQIWHQSRERIITPLSDNAGFSQFATFRRDYFANVIAHLRTFLNINSTTTKLAIYGEFCGGNIQSGVAINGLEKMFVVFGASVGEDADRTWLSPQVIDLALFGGHISSQNIYFIHNFPVWTLEIDFANPELSQNKLVEITEEIEKECPVGKHFGNTGIGEGAVWQCISELPYYQGLRFKVKGEKHSVSKVRTLAEVNPEKVASINEFVARTTTVNRLQQMKDKLVEMELDANDVRNIGTFLKYVGQDIIKEESDTLEVSGLNSKDVMGKISQVSRNWFLANISV